MGSGPGNPSHPGVSRPVPWVGRQDHGEFLHPSEVPANLPLWELGTQRTKEPPAQSVSIGPIMWRWKGSDGLRSLNALRNSKEVGYIFL